MFFRLLPLLLLLVLSPWTSACADDSLTIVFSSNTGGEFEPCPVCGGKAMGGLGRRATLFAELRRDHPGRILFLAGPNEFLPPAGLKSPTPKLARALAEAYEALGYDAIYPTHAETSWLRASGASLPGVARETGDRPLIRVVEAGGVRLGLVALPELPAGQETPPRSMIDAAARAARDLAAKADLVAGISPWGATAEAALLSSTDAPFDLLLGGGPGPGLAGRLMEEDRTLWARSYTMGKAFHTIRVRALAERAGKGRRWIKDGNLFLDFKVLNKDVLDEPAMAALLAGYKLEHVN